MRAVFFFWSVPIAEDHRNGEATGRKRSSCVPWAPIPPAIPCAGDCMHEREATPACTPRVTSSSSDAMEGLPTNVDARRGCSPLTCGYRQVVNPDNTETPVGSERSQVDCDGEPPKLSRRMGWLTSSKLDAWKQRGAADCQRCPGADMCPLSLHTERRTKLVQQSEPFPCHVPKSLRLRLLERSFELLTPK